MSDLLLLPPDGCPRLQRIISGLAGAASLHVMMLVTIITLMMPTKSRGPIPQPAPTPSIDLRMVTLTTPKPLGPTPTSEPPHTNRAAQSAPAPRVQVPSRIAIGPPPPRLLQLALSLRQDGHTTPSYSVQISADVLALFAGNGWGQVVVGAPPFKQAVELVDWTPSGTRGTRPVGDTLRRDLVSPRALRLPSNVVAALTAQVGESSASGTGYLLLTPAADLVILAGQLQACEVAHVAPERVRTTVGRFAVSPQRFDGIIVDTLELVDGNSVSVARSGA